MDSIIKYPVRMQEVSSSEYTAVLIDMPDLEPGKGATPAEAYNDLATRAISVVTDLMIKGEAPEASDAPDDVPVIGISPPVGISSENE